MAVPQKDVIKRLKAGETLVHVIEREKKSGNHKPYQYLSGGGRVTVATYEKLRPQLSPVSVGLFPDAEPQEWEWSGEQ